MEYEEPKKRSDLTIVPKHGTHPKRGEEDSDIFPDEAKESEIAPVSEEEELEILPWEEEEYDDGSEDSDENN